MMRKIIRTTALLLVVTLILPLTGCWDRRELEDLAFVLVIGIDEAPGGNLNVTFIVAKPSEMGGGGDKSGGGGKPYLVIEAIAPSIAGAMNVANSYSSRRLTLLHTNALIIGRSTAEKGITFLDGLSRQREVRGTAGFFVAQGTAAELLEKLASDLEPNPGKLFLSAMSIYEITGFIPKVNTFSALRRFQAPGSDPVATLIAIREKGTPAPDPAGALPEGSYTAAQLPRKVTANTLEFHGLAVFRENKMVGTLTGAETSAYGMIRGEFGTGYFTIPDPYDPKQIVVVELRLARKPEIKVEWASQNRPRRININLELEADITGIRNSNVDYTKAGPMRALEESIARSIKADCQRTVTKLQQMDADILGLALELRSHFTTTKELEQLKWRELFPETEISIEVDASIRRIGLQDAPLKVR